MTELIRTTQVQHAPPMMIRYSPALWGFESRLYFMMPTVHQFIDPPSKRTVAKRSTRKPSDEPKQSAKELFITRTVAARTEKT